jgi:hypothetical protein
MKGETNKFLIEGDLVKIYLVGKYSDRVALTDLKSFLKYELFDYIWRCDKNGYVYTIVNSQSLFLHRMITNNHSKDLQTDHIHNSDDPIKDKLDNRKSNLRVCTARENQMNSRLKKDNSSGYKGVHLIKDFYYMANTKVKGHKYNFGSYSTKKYENALLMAAYAYDYAVTYINGDFAQTNEIKENGLLTAEEMEIVEEKVLSKIEKHGLTKYKKVEAPRNIYTGEVESVILEA